MNKKIISITKTAITSVFLTSLVVSMSCVPQGVNTPDLKADAKEVCALLKSKFGAADAVVTACQGAVDKDVKLDDASIAVLCANKADFKTKLSEAEQAKVSKVLDESKCPSAPGKVGDGNSGLSGGTK